MSTPLSGKKLLSSSVIYTAGDFLTTLVSGFLLIPLYLRYMKPADYGLYSTVTVMINMLGVLMSVGISSAVGRFYFIYRESGEEYAYLGSVWLFQTIVALAMGGAFVLWGKPLWAAISPEIPYWPYIWIVVAGAILSFSASIYSLWLRIQEKPLGFVVLQFARTISFIGFLGIFLVLMGMGAYGALMAALTSSAILAIISLVFLARKTVWKIKPTFVKPSLVFGGWMVVGTFGYFFLNKSQLFFLQHYKGLTSVGIYNLGQQLGSVLMLLSASFSKAWQPVLFSAMNRDDASRIIAALSKYYIAGMLLMALPVALFSDEILQILARPDYFGARLIVRICGIGAFVYVLSMLPSSALLYEKRSDLSQAAVLFSALINIVLNLVLIPKWGIIGAALATLLSFTGLTVVSFSLAQRLLPVAYDWGGFGKIVLSGTVVLGIEWCFVSPLAQPLAFLLRVCLFFTFPALLLLLGVFRLSDFSDINSTVKELLRKLRPGS